MRQHRLAFASIVALLLLLGGQQRMTAQYSGTAAPVPPDVLNPTPKYWYIAPEIGLSRNSHPGDFQPECAECLFSDGSGTGVILGIQIEHLPNPQIGIALKLLFDDKRADYTRSLPSVERTVYDPANPDVPRVATLAVERAMHARLAYFVVNPMLEFFPIKNLYLLAGPAIGLPLASEYSVKERLLDENYTFVQSGSNEAPLQKEEWTAIPDATSPRVDVRAGIGYNLRLSRAVILAPELTYEVPLTKISSDDNWKADAIHGVLVLKFAL